MTDYVVGRVGRTFTVGVHAFTHPEIEETMMRLARERVDRDIEEMGHVPFGGHQVTVPEVVEYDAEDEETGEIYHYGPFRQFTVERSYTSEGA